MNFWARLRLFVIGILLGSVFVYFVLIRNNDFPAWTPSGRVLEQLQENPIKISTKLDCQLKEAQLKPNDVVYILASAEVIFKESEVRNVNEKKYVLIGKAQNNKEYKISFTPSAFTTLANEMIKNENFNESANCP